MTARITAESAAPSTEVTSDSPVSSEQGSTQTNPTESVHSPEVIESESNDTTSSDEGPAQTDEAKIELTDADKMKHAFEKRLGKLTGQKKDLSEQTSAQSERIAELERRIADMQDTPAEEADVDTMTEQEYIAHQVKIQRQAEQAEYARQQNEHKQREASVRTVQDQWNKKIDTFNKPDYVEVVRMAEQYIPQDVLQLAVNSDIGPELVYTIAKDIDTIERLTHMDPDRRKFELYTLEQKLKNPVSSAKPVPNADRGQTPHAKPFNPDKADMKEYLAHRANKRRR
jgi:hypothetical protein